MARCSPLLHRAHLRLWRGGHITGLQSQELSPQRRFGRENGNWHAVAKYLDASARGPNKEPVRLIRKRELDQRPEVNWRPGAECRWHKFLVSGSRLRRGVRLPCQPVGQVVVFRGARVVFAFRLALGVVAGGAGFLRRTVERVELGSNCVHDRLKDGGFVHIGAYPRHAWPRDTSLIILPRRHGAFP